MKTAFSFLLAAVLLFSCGKPEEFPEGGFKRDAGRNLLRKWTVTSFMINDADSLSKLPTDFRGENAIIMGAWHESLTIRPFADMVTVGNNFRCNLFLESDELHFEMNDFYNQNSLAEPFMVGLGHWEILRCDKNQVKLHMHYVKDYVLVMN